jgi:hypothetical protein
MPTILKQVYRYDQEKTRAWPVASGTQAGTAVLSPAGNQPGVAITARGDSTVTTSLVGTATSITLQNGGFNNKPTEATVATDGSWAGAVTGASSSTPRGTLVYFVVADGTLTLTAGSNVKFGVVDSPLGRATASDTTVLIGVFA